MLREEGKVAGGEKDFVRRMREEYFPNMTAGDVMEKLRELVIFSRQVGSPPDRSSFFQQ